MSFDLMCFLSGIIVAAIFYGVITYKLLILAKKERDYYGTYEGRKG